MGSRAFVTFKSGEDYSPAVYLHWDGHKVPEWLKAAAPRMRQGDAAYAAARFCGHCHEQIKGGLSLGLMPPPNPKAPDFTWAGYCDGDNGVFIVDVDKGKVINEAASKPVKAFTITLGDF